MRDSQRINGDGDGDVDVINVNIKESQAKVVNEGKRGVDMAS